MEYIQSGSRSLSLIYKLNVDRILYIATIAFALGLGGVLGTL